MTSMRCRRSSFGQVEMLPGAQQALDYLRGKIGDFLNLPRRLNAMTAKARRLYQAARLKGDTSRASALFAILRSVDGLRDTYAKAETKLKSIAGALSTVGVTVPGAPVPTSTPLGFLPLAIVGTVLAVVAVMAYLFKAVSYQERLLADIEAKVVTPEEAKALSARAPIFSGPAFFGGVSLPLLAAGGVVAFLMFRGGVRQRA